jgi:YVTN family beta-propeller protein
VIATIPVGNSPAALTWNSQNNKVYCANESTNTVTVIDGQTNSVIRNITVGNGPKALVWNAQNNKIYCANAAGSYPNYDSTVTVIDGQTDSVITTITVGNGPWAFCWNPLQNRIYVANYMSSTISVIRDSILSGIEENHQPLNADHMSLEVFPNPAKTYFNIHSPLNAQGSRLRMYDVTGKIVKELESSGNRELRVSLDGIKNGVYFVRVGNEMVKEKLVVTR